MKILKSTLNTLSKIPRGIWLLTLVTLNLKVIRSGEFSVKLWVVALSVILLCFIDPENYFPFNIKTVINFLFN